MESASLNSSVTFMENRADYDFMARVVVGSLVEHMEMQQEQPQQRQQQLLCLHHVPCRMSRHSRCDRERERRRQRGSGSLGGKKRELEEEKARLGME